MIKILNIISDSNIGGAGRCVLTFLKYFDRSNFQVKVIVPTNSLLIPEIKKLGIDTIEAEGIAEKSLSRNGIKILKKYRNLFLNHGYIESKKKWQAIKPIIFYYN